MKFRASNGFLHPDDAVTWEWVRGLGRDSVVELSEVGPDKPADTRTDQQRKAIEVYCRELAKALNNAGLDQVVFFHDIKIKKADAKVPWSQVSIKELWRTIQKAMFGKESTTELEPAEVSKVYDAVNRITSGMGVSVVFPDRFGGQ